MMPFTLGLNILEVKKVVLHMFFLINMQKSKLTYHSLPLEKTMILHNVRILSKSVVDKNQNRYYYNIFLEKSYILINHLKIMTINKSFYKLQMLYYDRIDVSEDIDVNKISASKESIIYHYRYFLIKGFKFQSDVCNGCHDTAILTIRSVDYCCTILTIAN